MADPYHGMGPVGYLSFGQFWPKLGLTPLKWPIHTTVWIGHFSGVRAWVTAPLLYQWSAAPPQGSAAIFLNLWNARILMREVTLRRRQRVEHPKRRNFATLTTQTPSLDAFESSQ